MLGNPVWWALSDKQCEICDEPLTVHWTDTHGVAACMKCGAGYRLLHYEGDSTTAAHRIELGVKTECVPVLKCYVAETGRQLPSGFNLPGSSYEFCPAQDAEFFHAWIEEHADAMLKPAAPKEHP